MLEQKHRLENMSRSTDTSFSTTNHNLNECILANIKVLYTIIIRLKYTVCWVAEKWTFIILFIHNTVMSRFKYY